MLLREADEYLNLVAQLGQDVEIAPVTGRPGSFRFSQGSGDHIQKAMFYVAAGISLSALRVAVDQKKKWLESRRLENEKNQETE